MPRIAQRALVSALILLWICWCLTACSEPIRQAEIPEDYPAPDRVYDLNTVTYDELLTIDGIKKNVARAIVVWRAHRPYRRLEDLLSVDGIGEKTFLRIRRFFRVTHERIQP